MSVYNSYDENPGIDFDFDSTEPSVFKIVTREVMDELWRAKAIFRSPCTGINCTGSSLHSICAVGSTKEAARDQLLHSLRLHFGKPQPRTHWDGCWRVHHECCLKKAEELADAVEHWKRARQDAVDTIVEQRKAIEHMANLVEAMLQRTQARKSWEEAVDEVMRDQSELWSELAEL
jgi:hypothetical protein